MALASLTAEHFVNSPELYEKLSSWVIFDLPKIKADFEAELLNAKSLQLLGIGAAVKEVENKQDIAAYR